MEDTTAEDKAVCDAARAFIGGVLALEEPHRANLLRYLAVQACSPNCKELLAKKSLRC